MSKPLTQTTGRRKAAVARVRLRAGEGNLTVNGRALEAHFPSAAHRNLLTEPLRLTETEGQYDIDATLDGGGTPGAGFGLGLAALPPPPAAGQHEQREDGDDHAGRQFVAGTRGGTGGLAHGVDRKKGWIRRH